MSSVRVVPRKDGSTYTQILFREFDAAKGRRVQSSVSFDDHGAALRWQKVLDQSGPEQARALLAVEEEISGERVVTLNDSWAETYIKGLTGVEQATRDRYRRYMVNDIGPAMGDLPLAALCAATADQNSVVQEWVNEQEADGYAPKTIANKHGFLSGCLRAAVKRKLLPFNPCEDTKLPKGRRECVFLEPEEFDIVYAAVPQRWRPMVLFLVTTGMRYSEATAIRVGDLNRHVHDDGLVFYTARISKAWKYTGTAERKLGGPKTQRGWRTINVPAETIEELKLDGRGKDQLLFRTRNDKRIIPQQFHNLAWKPAMEAVADRLGKKPRPHDLRHTCASWMLNNGAEITDVSAHLGHESIKTTVDVYGHLDRRSGHRASTAISKALVRTAVRIPAANDSDSISDHSGEEADRSRG
ncbi:tyrosine-type recombinase/integrase [Nocardia asiatica]|uniref:tyrosine-type recombinase/integrase n=1 Tax=Nocardia asiatica TaxID=209252 RepID=UPI002458E390|nr:site-specific integrase [Nocardia asiatica]